MFLYKKPFGAATGVSWADFLLIHDSLSDRKPYKAMITWQSNSTTVWGASFYGDKAEALVTFTDNINNINVSTIQSTFENTANVSAEPILVGFIGGAGSSQIIRTVNYDDFKLAANVISEGIYTCECCGNPENQEPLYYFANNQSGYAVIEDFVVFSSPSANSSVFMADFPTAIEVSANLEIVPLGD